MNRASLPRGYVALALAALFLTALLVQPASAGSASGRHSSFATQERLAALGDLPDGAVSGRSDERTRQAILAFQGWEGLPRDGVAGAVTLARLETAGRPAPLRGSGPRIEVRLDRQVALLVRGMPYPASHGCVRIPLTEARTVYAFARLGVAVRVVARSSSTRALASATQTTVRGKSDPAGRRGAGKSRADSVRCSSYAPYDAALSVVSRL